MRNLIFLMLLTPMVFVHGQNFRGLDKSPMDKAAFPVKYKISNKVAVITYSRPQLRGRTFNEIVPLNKVWRTGANEATELRVFKPIIMGGEKLDIGTYTLYTLFDENEVTLIVNGAVNVWGAYSYDKNKDVARVTVPLSKSDDTLEALSIAFESNAENPAFYIGWDNIRVKVPFTVL